ncbi:MAG: hypothetical protein ACTSSH_00355, partial [Candidatus Heimdallarchaeota archaeon]
FFIKSEIDTILTVVMSGITMVTLIAFTLFDHGFVKINHELNVILGIWFVWCLTTLGLAFIHRRNQTLHFTFLIIVILLSAIGPFFGFILVYDNVFAIICGIQIFIALAISMLTVFLDEELIVKKFLGYIGINLIAIIIFSFSFRLSFDWLNNVNKSYVVDYTLLIPLVLITTIVLTQKFYQESKEGKGISPSHYHENQEIVKNDMLFFATFIILLTSSVLTHLQNFTNFEYLLLKGLIISIIFVATTIPLNIRYTTILSLISTMVFLITVLLYLGGVSNYAAFITLLAIVGVVLVFAIINDLFLIGEPLTTNLSIVGMLVGMLASIIFFYIENMPLKEIWTSTSWAILGMFQFASGIMFNRIFLRRTGLMIILFDIVYSLIAISIQYRGWQMGVAFIVLALVLLLCIYLLRWSEKKEKKESELEVTA